MIFSITHTKVPLVEPILCVAMDREQKLFLEASDWEAKFYQIQSKYLLLLNELHNPQVRMYGFRLHNQLIPRSVIGLRFSS